MRVVRDSKRRVSLIASPATRLGDSGLQVSGASLLQGCCKYPRRMCPRPSSEASGAFIAADAGGNAPPERRRDIR